MDLRDLLFYSNNKCLFCLEEDNDKGFVCSKCLKNLDYVDRQVELRENIKVYYPYYYNGFLRDKFTKYKFEKKSYMAKAFSSLLINYIIEKDLDTYDYIIYVPISNNKRLERGYNQVELIANRIGKELDVEVIDFFKKVFDTKEQNKLSWEERKDNLKFSLEIRREYRNKKILKDKKVLLIDDLITSGRTLEELIDLLEDEEIEKISALVLASSKQIV